MSAVPRAPHGDRDHPSCQVHSCCIGHPATECRAPDAAWIAGTGIMSDPDVARGAATLIRMALLFCAEAETAPVFGAWAQGLLSCLQDEDREWASLNSRRMALLELELALQRGQD